MHSEQGSIAADQCPHLTLPPGTECPQPVILFTEETTTHMVLATPSNLGEQVPFLFQKHMGQGASQLLKVTEELNLFPLRTGQLQA